VIELREPALTRKIPISGFPLLVYKLREAGLPWLLDRVQREWQMPRTAAGQMAYRTARRIRRAFGGSAPRSFETNGELYAFYDLAVAPITFDFLWFLVTADIERRRLKRESIHVVVVPGPDSGVRREDPFYEEVVNAPARRARITRMLLPACGLLPSVSGVTVAGSRAQAERLVASRPEVFPANYEPVMPVYAGPQQALQEARTRGAEIATLRAADSDLHAIDRWLSAHGCEQPVVTITLREYGYMPERNSNLNAWVSFARGLDPAHFSVVFIRDTEVWFDVMPEELRGIVICSAASLDLGLRMALYQRAHLNLGVNNGPMGLCWLNERARYLTFKILTDEAPQTTPEYMRHLGFDIGKSLPFAKPWQKWVWEQDSLPVIQREFAEMLERLP
jgi:hypothetical protein